MNDQKISIPVGQAAVEFHRCVHLALGTIGLLQHDIRLGKTLLDVSSGIYLFGLYQVAARVDAGSTGVEGLLFVYDKRQHVVFY